MTEERREAALRQAIKIRRDFGRTSQLDINAEVAKNTVNDEAGQFGQYPHTASLSPEEVHTVLLNGREDAAHALLNTITLYHEVRSLRRWIIALMAVAVAAVVVITGGRP